MNNVFTTHSMHGMSVYETVQVAPKCFYARQLAHLPDVPPTPEELAEYDAEGADYEAYMKAHGYEERPEWSHYGCYTTEHAARRCIELHDEMNAYSEDVHAWGAPSECLVDACRGPVRKLEKLEDEFGTRYPDEPPPNPYTERGLDDRTRPIGECLPPGMTDDRDILAALGERGAL